MSEVASKAKPGGVRLGLLVGGFGVLVLFGAIGRRFVEARADKAAVSAVNASLAAANEGPRAVKTIRPRVTPWQPIVKVTGEVSPVRETQLSFKQPGRLATVAVKLGDKVTAGQLLATLDPLDASAQAGTAYAMVRAAELDVAISQENVERAKLLFEKSAISQTEYRGEQQRQDGAQARLNTARAQAGASNVALANTRLSAPFAGTVVQAPSAPGAVVMPGTPLFRLEDTSSLRLSATVHPSDVRNLALGALVELEGEPKLVGRLTVIFPSVDPQTRRVPIYAELKNDGAAPLLARSFVRAQASGAGTLDVLKLPATALKAGSQDELWLIRSGKASTAHVVFTTGEDGTLYVHDGVTEKDEVILAAGQALHEGDSVQGTSITEGGSP